MIGTKVIDRDFQKFVKEGALGARSWLMDERMQVYVRLNKRYIKHKEVSSFEIANVTVDVNLRNKGYFRSFMEFAIKNNPCEVIFIENANEIIAGYCERRNWIKVQNSFYLENPKVTKTTLPGY